MYNLKFKEIFKEDGLYTSESFREGVAFKIRNETLYMVTYRSKDDLLPTEDYVNVYLGLFKKKYKKVFTIGSLFNK
jgi:hypothetical protein